LEAYIELIESTGCRIRWIAINLGDVVVECDDLLGVRRCLSSTRKMAFTWPT
jgi:hypothetical protein